MAEKELEQEKKPKNFLRKGKGKEKESTEESKQVNDNGVIAKKEPVKVKKKAVVKVKKKPARSKPVDKGVASGSSNVPKRTMPSKQGKDKAIGTSRHSTEKPKRDMGVGSIFQERPNVKAGNLADQSKKNRSGGNLGRRGYNNDRNSGQNRGKQGFSGYNNRNDGNRAGGYRGQGSGNRGGQQGRSQFGNKRPPQAAPVTPPGQGKGSASKRVQKGKKQIYAKRQQEQKEFFDSQAFHKKKKAIEKVNTVPASVEMLETITVSDLAKKMNLKASTLIAKLMGMGMMVTMNQSIDYDTAAILASEYNCDVKLVSLYDETVIKTESDEGIELISRAPVVTIMGHVDHGKTKTLDAIRSSNVVDGEFGGITQHIGAYMVNTPGGSITFLDTPGHEAFTMMRARGAALTDIVVLVVAADDGVMPQTIEAINHAKDAEVPIIVAINKVDKPEANPEKVMSRLSELGLMPEDWGGDTMYVHISALQKTGIDTLLETIILQAEVLELKANFECKAEGKVIESRIDHGRGIVATILVQRGLLKTGDPYVAGIYSGRVRAIFNDKGARIDTAEPSMPVEILGLEGMPNAGDPFQVTATEKEARQFSEKRQELKRFEASQNVRKVTLDNLYETIHDGDVLVLKVIIKGDVQGSVEALKQSLEKLSTPEIRLNVIHASAGAINDSDVMLAVADTNAIIIGFNVRPTPQARALAEQEKIDIRKYTIIYEAVEEMRLAMEGMLSPEIKEKVVGMVEVRDVFKVPKVGKIAGCYVNEGTVKRNSSVHIIRDGIVVFSGKLASLRRFKDDAKEVNAGYECGIGIQDFNDIQVGDQLEVIDTIEIARKLSDTQVKSKKPAEGGSDE
ncbi:MAG: translation initiation factor IF-2 [Treponema sp.]|nr:MAG: translation initiation factor IF-2 [Treponema sp.]